MNKKYFFFDKDGTLAIETPGQQSIPESTKLALQKLREQGHFLAIATGRSYAMAKETMGNLGFYNMVSDGGNGITIDDQLLGIEPLDYKQIYKVYIACLAPKKLETLKELPWCRFHKDIYLWNQEISLLVLKKSLII